MVRVKDVARVELGAQIADIGSFYNGAPSAALGIYQAPGANAVQVADAVRAELERLAERFPEDLAYEIVYDTTVFVKTSIEEVVHTLVEAFVLVAIVVFLFLGKLRTTLIPIIAVPVSLIGTFAVMLAIGFSANTVSLLALVLAIGIVVDDAIVVVENVERVMEEEPHLSAKEATSKAMGEIVAPIIAITLVLLVGVRAGRLHPRHQRPAVPAVRGRRLGLDGDLGDQRAEPEPGALLGAAEARRARHARADALRHGRDRLHPRRLCRGRQAAGAGRRCSAWSPWRRWCSGPARCSG